MAARSTIVTLENSTRFNLLLQSHSVDHGVIVEPLPDIIGNWGRWKSESNGILTGTEGHATYSIHDLDDVEHGLVHVHWDNPFLGSNSYDESASPTGPDGFFVYHTGGSGNDAEVTFSLFIGDCELGAAGELICRDSQQLTIGGVQSSWRFCAKCHGLFFDGFNEKGACPAGAGHAAAGFIFLLPHDLPAKQGQQLGFRFCSKCFVLFRPGTGLGPASGDPGICPQGGGHDAQGFRFRLPLSHQDPHGQDDWVRCGKCRALFFNGAPGSVCPVGGAHTRAVNLQGQPETSLKLDFQPGS
jgi:hypothetical protein